MPSTSRASSLAVKLLLRQKNLALCTDPFHLDCNGSIIVDSLQHYAQCVGGTPDDFMTSTTRDCFALNLHGRHLILYNRDVLCMARKRWSVAHEIGHICCRHCCDGPAQEDEANAFAAELLLPCVVAQELMRRGKVHSANDLCTLFGVSQHAAALRFPELLEHRATVQDEELLRRYLSIIEEELHGPIIDVPRSYAVQRSALVL